MRHLSVVPVLLALLCAAYAGAEPSAEARAESKREVLTVMGHDSTVVPEEVLAEFEERYGARVSILLAGDAGTALNRAILAQGNPLADVLYGVDNAFLSRALQEGVFERYEPPALANIAPELRLDASGHATPIDFGDVCVNYDITYFDAAGLAPPQRLEDLIEPAYADLLVVQNPAASSPGLAFLLATIGRFGDPGYLDYWQALRDNGVRVAPDWESAYFAEFSGGTSGGDRPLVVSYGSSPPFEVIYAETPIEAPTTGVMIGEESCFRQIEFAGILAGTPRRELAERWIDFMLGASFQAAMPLNMFVFPVLDEVPLVPEFERFLSIPERTAQVDPAAIAEHRERWIRAWRELMAR
jgi:thiamine transport system substrate-binding protein